MGIGFLSEAYTIPLSARLYFEKTFTCMVFAEMILNSDN